MKQKKKSIKKNRQEKLKSIELTCQTTQTRDMDNEIEITKKKKTIINYKVQSPIN